jgi:hypothetical protein
VPMSLLLRVIARPVRLPAADSRRAVSHYTGMNA